MLNEDKKAENKKKEPRFKGPQDKLWFGPNEVIRVRTLADKYQKLDQLSTSAKSSVEMNKLQSLA